jgi:CubicO group peptidase (beta-lactamase class C family)
LQLARLANFMVLNGSYDDVKFVSKEVLDKALVLQKTDLDNVIGANLTFTAGGWGYVQHLIVQNMSFYGWAGAGGSMMWWNYEHQIAFSYVMNFCHLQSIGDHRSWALIREVSRIALQQPS